MPTVRILTYNILCGGEERLTAIAAVIERIQPDYVVLQELFEDAPIRQMAHALGMEAYLAPIQATPSHVGILSKKPIVQWTAHEHQTMLRAHLSCDIDTAELGRVRLHAIHLAARFGERAHGELRRLVELRCIFDDIAADPTVEHHLLVGDFNSIAPRDVVNATGYFSRLHELRSEQLLVRDDPGERAIMSRLGRLTGRYSLAEDHSQLERVGINAQLAQSIQPLPAIALTATKWMPSNSTLNAVLSKGVRRQVIQDVLDHGFVDCYRRLHRRARGFTCATWIPATRVDYFFATAALARTLRSCDVVGAHRIPDADVTNASDHFPLLGTFEWTRLGNTTP